MNNEINIPLPRITDFPHLNEAFLARFSAAYLPDMSYTEIRNCQKYYHRHRRAPSGASELAFLNALALKMRRAPEAFLISEMLTDDGFLAETFADLMAKRAAVDPDYKAPCSLSEIPRIAQKYLEAQAPTPSKRGRLKLSLAPDPVLTLCAEKTAAHLLCDDSSLRCAGGTVPSRALTYTAPLAEGDRVYAFLKGVDPIENFEETLLRFATSKAVQGCAKRMCPVGADGVFAAMTSLGRGFETDVTRLYGQKTSATRLLSEEYGLLLVLKDADAAPLLIDALDMGLRPRLAGVLRNDERILLQEDAATLFRFSHHFIESLAFARAYRAEMNPPSALPFCPTALTETSVAAGEEKLFAVGVGADASRHAALYATLHAVTTCVVHGADVRDVRIADRTSLVLDDISPKAVGAQLALLLGLYRAVTEFELSSLDSHVLAANTADFSVCAVAREPERPTPCRLQSQHSSIYLLGPLYDENGNPDFADVKKMLDYFGKLCRDGKILSARAVVGDVLPVLEKMSEKCLVEYLLEEPRTALPGSILVETKEELEGILIGKTRVPETAPEETE